MGLEATRCGFPVAASNLQCKEALQCTTSQGGSEGHRDHLLRQGVVNIPCVLQPARKKSMTLTYLLSSDDAVHPSHTSEIRLNPHIGSWFRNCLQPVLHPRFTVNLVLRIREGMS